MTEIVEGKKTLMVRLNTTRDGAIAKCLMMYNPLTCCGSLYASRLLLGDRDLDKWACTMRVFGMYISV